MNILTASEARRSFYKLMDDIAEAHDPVLVKGKRNKIVMIGEEDFRAMQETLYILSVPGMRESIQKGRTEPLDQCSDKLSWE